MDQQTLKREIERNDPGRLGILLKQCSGNNNKLNYANSEIENLAKALQDRPLAYTANKKENKQGNQGNKNRDESRSRDGSRSNDGTVDGATTNSSNT